MERTIELTPNYEHIFRSMLRETRTQGDALHMFRLHFAKDRAELLREVQRWFAPLTIAANCATTRDAIGELREAMTEMLAAIDREAQRQERLADAADPTDGKGLL